ncbi:hypothetical protein ACO0LC_17955 [Undibacterium sp. JH2W]|uniref:hypothetical protein n=1 Tax=Undibacterium sp. JH2W TaxID=3413037 RepID=UPI003BF192F6
MSEPPAPLSAPGYRCGDEDDGDVYDNFCPGHTSGKHRDSTSFIIHADSMESSIAAGKILCFTFLAEVIETCSKNLQSIDGVAVHSRHLSLAIAPTVKAIAR